MHFTGAYRVHVNVEYYFVTINEDVCFIDLEWKMIYVGSAESEQYDQVLDTIYVGPVPEGRHMFVFEVSIVL